MFQAKQSITTGMKILLDPSQWDTDTVSICIQKPQVNQAMGNCSARSPPTALEFNPLETTEDGSAVDDAMGLDEKTIGILKATAPVVKEHGTAITSAMYRILFWEYPEVKNLFNMSHHRTMKNDGSDQPSPQVRVVFPSSLPSFLAISRISTYLCAYVVENP